jgi:hypothetical protein
MKPTLRKQLRLGALVTILVVGPSVVYVAPAFDLRAGCERGKDWARNHPAEIPSSMAELMAFPSSMRNGIFTVMSPERQAAIWKEPLLAFRDFSRLTLTQRQLIDRAIQDVSPVLYSNQTTPDRTLGAVLAGAQVLPECYCSS